jgi:hypothetical protein
MDAIYIVAILLQVGVLVFFINRIVKGMKARKEAPGKAVSTYEEFRQASLGVTEGQLKLEISSSVLKVFGVVMDWDMSGTVLTLSTYITGAANAALSSGASITGGGKNPLVAEKASEFVQSAQNYISRAVPATAGGILVPGTVRFYLLTNHGLYAAQELISSIHEESSPWTDLFIKGNLVLSELKKGSE